MRLDRPLRCSPSPRRGGRRRRGPRAPVADLRPFAETRRLRDRLWDGLRARFGEGVVRNGHPGERLPNTLNISFVGRVGADILAALDGVAASAGAACHADSVELSPMLRAMGVPPVVGMGAVRLGLRHMTTEAEIDEVLDRLAAMPGD